MAGQGVEVSVVSGDRDLLQLADERIKIRIPKTSRGVTEVHDYYPEDVKREYQVTPQEFIFLRGAGSHQLRRNPYQCSVWIFEYYVQNPGGGAVRSSGGGL